MMSIFGIMDIMREGLKSDIPREEFADASGRVVGDAGDNVARVGFGVEGVLPETALEFWGSAS